MYFHGEGGRLQVSVSERRFDQLVARRLSIKHSSGHRWRWLHRRDFAWLSFFVATQESRAMPPKEELARLEAYLETDTKPQWCKIH